MNNKIDPLTKSMGKIINMIPGTLIYKGEEKNPFSIDRIMFNKERCDRNTYDSLEKMIEDRREISEEEFIQWINITGINHVDKIKDIGRYFDISPLILEQIVSVTKNSFYQKKSRYWFNDLQMFYLQDRRVVRENISIYLSNNVILTFQEKEGDVFDNIRERIINNKGYIRERNIHYTYFCILDALVDHYLNVSELLRADIEGLEFDMFESEQLEYKKLNALRKHTMLMKMNINVVDKLIADISGEETIQELLSYFESLKHHVQTVNDEMDIQRLAIDSIYDNYMMTNSNNMNQIMTTLTIFSAIFIPLSFVAGVFGMNFVTMPGTDNANAFFYFLIGCVITATGMLTFFKVKKWF